jgi:phospholipid/cholesterol/gamma-HCH transport system substrate-binding protein
VGYGGALGAEPEAGEDDDQLPETQGETAGESLNDSLEYSADALRGSAIVNAATLGTELHDLSKLIGAQAKIYTALSSREGQLKDLITNFNITMAAFASEENNLRATIRELPQVLEAANPALDNLNAAFPSARAWALETIPGVRELPATIEAAYPWIRQTRALFSQEELGGLVKILRPTVPDLAAFVEGQNQFLPQLDLFNRCQLEVVLPAGDQRIQDGNLSTGLRNYEEFFQTLVNLSGESQNFDGNGSYIRTQPGGGPFRVQTQPVGRLGPLHANASFQPLGTRPAKSSKPPYKPDFACHRNPEPNLSAARTGSGP